MEEDFTTEGTKGTEKRGLRAQARVLVPQRGVTLNC